MLKASENLFLIALKTLLQSKRLYIGILLIAVINGFYVVNNELYKSKYIGNETIINGYVKELNIDGNHLKMVIYSKEQIIVNYYIDSLEELNIIKQTYFLGDYIKATGVMERPKTNTVFNLFNYKNYLLSQKIYFIFKAENIEKLNISPKLFYIIKKKVISRIESIKKSSPYIKNYLISKTDDIDESILESYQNNGLNHLLSLSSDQLSLLATFILFVISKKSKHKFLNYFLVSIVLCFYLLISGSPPSLLRAVMMFVFLKINELFELKVTTINLFLLIFSLLLLYNPYYIYHLGFVFSFSISFYLIIFKNLINQYDNYIIKSLLISSIAFLVSMPVLINTFFEINLLTPIINLIFIPIFSFVIFPFSIITFLFPFLDNLLYLVITFTEALSKMLSNISIFTITLKTINPLIFFLYYLVITYLLVAFKNKKYYCLIYIPVGLLIHYYSSYFNIYPVITFIDVGQGDSILIELPQNKGNILIDTGGFFNYSNDEWSKKKEYSIAISKIIPYLKSRGIKSLDYLILTHGDYDHLGEGKKLLSKFKINKLIFNSGNNNHFESELMNYAQDKGNSYEQYNQATLNINGYFFYFLNKQTKQNENEDSLIIYTKLNNKNILLMGDAGISSEKYLINEYNLPKMDILKIGHHGSKNSTSTQFLELLRPNYSVISVGLNNRFNHPHEQVLKLLNDYQFKYYLTSLSGSIKFIIKDSIIIKTCL
ncbi:MAG: DNA internalization-related competence protein ComEC/Rec2 [Bacilli bacterium]|nr:DNA internalization-related competence protein ComEC/Rec2 [Bacilli bacterium]